jgi:hypothetical protein
MRKLETNAANNHHLVAAEEATLLPTTVVPLWIGKAGTISTKRNANFNFEEVGGGLLFSSFKETSNVLAGITSL